MKVINANAPSYLSKVTSYFPRELVAVHIDSPIAEILVVSGSIDTTASEQAQRDSGQRFSHQSWII